MKKNIITVLFIILLIPFSAYGQEDIFQVKTPNAMIIFDTSSSINMDPSGNSVSSHNACIDADGNLQTTNQGHPPCSGGYTSYNFESGGNHPDSKLYQAKLALKQVIQEVVQDKVNLGFSTYAQSKTEKRRGYYKRDRRNYTTPIADRWRWTKVYWRFNNYRHSYNTTSFSPNSFTDFMGNTQSGVSIGYTFYYTHTFNNSPNNNGMNVPPPHPPGTYNASLRYTVTNIVYNAEYNWYTYYYQSDTHDHYEETTRTVYFFDSNPIDCDSVFTTPWGSWKTYRSTDAEQIANPGKWACQGPFLVPGTPGGFGSWYVEYTWLEFNPGTTCPSPAGSAQNPSGNPGQDQWTQWSLVDPPKCYDWSTYFYPATGSSNQPHLWSYFKTVGNCPPGGPGCNWPEPLQLPNYYPSKDGSGNVNNTPGTFDNHYFFVNFPDDKDVGFTPAVRTAIRDQVLSFLDLTPVQSPESLRYWTKLPVHAYYGKTGLTSNTQDSIYTPLADSLKYSFKYFNDYIYNYNGGDPPSQQQAGGTLCRGNYVILLTDGLESARFSGGLPDYTAAPTEAANLLAINVKTFVIGFGTDLQGNQTLNAIASAGGTTQAYFAANMEELKAALSAIFQAIISTTYGRSNPVISKTGDRTYRGFFELTADDSWKGRLWAYDINTTTGEIIEPFVWDGAQKMIDYGRGNVYAWTGSGLSPTRQVFDDDNSTLYPFVNPMNEDINEDGEVDDEDAETVINFTLDPAYDGGRYKGKRPVEGGIGWKLGDIYHSTPVVISAPPFLFTDHEYSTFYNNYKNRTTMIYVGANEGFLHGFKNTPGTPSTDGRESFSIIPKSLLGKLKNLKSVHDYYVDGSPKAYDVFFSSEPAANDWEKWKTVIISGLRAGGPYYFAIDVTNPDNSSYPKILWEWTDANMGESWAKPDAGKVSVSGATKYVAFITGGYSTTNNKSNSFYVVDIETGTTLKSWKNLGSPTNKIPSSPTAYDSNGDGLVDYIYFGDTSGTLWKVDVRSTNINDWTCSALFTPSVPAQIKPIFYAPAVAKNDEGKILVFFGTGEELNLQTSTTNYFWEIWDDNGTARIIGSNWPTVLTGEKVLSSPVIANYVVYFTSWLYTVSGEFCGAGEGRLYGLKISNGSVEGGVAGLVTLDAQGNPNPPVQYVSLGAGIPSSPVVTNGSIYVSNSVNAKDIIQIQFQGWTISRTRGWREVF